MPAKNHLSKKDKAIMKENLHSLIIILRSIVGLGLLVYAFIALYVLAPFNMSHTSLNEFIFILYCPLVMILSIILSFRSYKWAGVLLTIHALIYIISSAIEDEPILFIGIPTLGLGILFYWYSRFDD